MSPLDTIGYGAPVTLGSMLALIIAYTMFFNSKAAFTDGWSYCFGMLLALIVH